MTLAAVVSVLHHGHEHSGAALLARALAAQPVDLAVLVHLRMRLLIAALHAATLGSKSMSKSL